MNWITKQIERLRTWWNNNHRSFERDITNGLINFLAGINRIGDNVIRLIIIGIIVNIIANYFWPEFPERFPVIYGWFDGWLQFGEFAVKAALGGVYSFFTGQWSEFWTEYSNEFHALLQQLGNWLSTLRF